MLKCFFRVDLITKAYVIACVWLHVERLPYIIATLWKLLVE